MAYSYYVAILRNVFYLYVYLLLTESKLSECAILRSFEVL
jgi:hypothetical protein